MRRAVLALLLAAVLPLPVFAAKPAGPVDAIGMIDFRRGPHFKVGDWVTYQTKGQSEQGYRTDYTVTVLIAGEELWWGEECFWVETATSYAGAPPELTASLLSYAAFEDTFAARRFQRYIRKYVEGFDAEGRAVQQLFQRSPAEFINRGYGEWEPDVKKDTVGVEPVEVPKGRFDGLKELRRFHEYTTKQVGDSTVYFELIEDHAYYWSDQVPITSLVRVDQENTQRRRVWMIGESANAPLRIVEHTKGSSVLIDYGSGMKAHLIPERLQRPLSEQKAAQPKVPAKRPATAAPRKPAG